MSARITGYFHPSGGLRLTGLLAMLALAWLAPAAGQGVIFVGDMEERSVEPLFPVQGGQIQLPDGPTTTALQWLLTQFVPGANPSDQDIAERFSSNWLTSIDVQATRDFILSVQGGYPDAVVTDLVAITPMAFTGLITGSGGNEGFMILETGFADGRINRFGVQGFGSGAGTVVYAEDQGLDLNGAVAKFATLSTQPGLLVAQIDEDNLCVPIATLNAETLRATASIFKIWVLGAIADAIADRSLTTDQLVPRVDSERAAGGPLLNEPNNTLFTLNQLAVLMLGISDNTATNLLHELAGRDRLDRIVAEFGHAMPEALTPLLNINEAFHLLFSFSLGEAQSYIDGSESFQQQFLTNRIEPLGSLQDNGGGFNNLSLFTTGTWLASANDVCQALAAQRTWANGSDQALQVDRALGAQAAQPNVRNAWDRVWYKGGSLTTSTGLDVVLTHAWLLENSGQAPYVLVALANSPNSDIDDFAIQSITGRILELIAQLP